MGLDVNCISYWFPKLDRVLLPVPRTVIVHAGGDLSPILDGQQPECWDRFMRGLELASSAVGCPCFLRTGHGSGKHEWDDTCYVRHRRELGQHVYNLVEWSHLVDIMGLPTEIWAVRELIETEPLFYAFRGMPITREFRLFVRAGCVEHFQPYWIADAITQPSMPDWADKLAEASRVTREEEAALWSLAARAGKALGDGYWSVDLLEDRFGKLWITDCADGDRSFRWDPETGEEF